MDLTHLQSTDVTATDTADYSILDNTVIIRQHSHYQTTLSLSDTTVNTLWTIVDNTKNNRQY